ncbi:hypothetical protein FVER14953_14019 [Fusarium verticillioides]|nr:hypothetical protein FVER14953_14019 [Fusarium verticillioides]
MAHVSIIPAPILANESAATSAWCFQSDIESEITALAAWCQVKQQQREPLKATTEEDDDASSDELINEHDVDCLTDDRTLLTKDGTKLIKQDFLDRLAELLCCMKKPSFITCTAMIEEQDEVTIVAARNGAKWTADDKNLMEELATIMERLSSDGPRHITALCHLKQSLTTLTDPFDEDPLPRLQSRLTEYYAPRLRHHVQELVKHEGGKTDMIFFTDTCRVFLSNKISLQDFAQRVENLSYNTDFYSVLRATFTTAVLKRLIDDLAFIRRPMQGARAFCYAAKKLGSFQKIKIRLLGSYPSRAVSHVRFPRKRLPLPRGFEKKFEAEVRKVKWVHAEMRVITHLLNEDSDARRVGLVSYLGVSKRTCFLCGHIIQQMGQFQTRANHGKIYSQWTLPSAVLVEQRDAVRLQDAVEHLRDVLRREADRDDLRPIDPEKESVMATPLLPPSIKSTPFTQHVKDPRRLQRESDWLSHLARRDRTSREDIESDSSGSASGPGGEALPGISNEARTSDHRSVPETAPKTCANCKIDSGFLVSCPKCDSVLYCDADCCKAHWPTHKFCCKLGQPIDSVDYLVLACRTNRFPEDEDTATAYGFRYFTSAKDRARLFKLYCRLVNQGGVVDKELREVLHKDQLKEFILFRSSQLPWANSQDDIDWLRKQQGFKANVVCPDLGQKFIDSVRNFLSPEDRDVCFSDLSPLEKRQAYVFYGQILNGYVPDADEDNWITLGFCTAPGDQGAFRLADLYTFLVQKCQFEEFWKAMADSTMIELLRKYGIGHKIAQLRNFEHHMGIVATCYHSVWELKRFTKLADPHPMRAVDVDYGFVKCSTARERLLLRQIYTDYFSRGEDEMKLHEACVSGRLAEFLESVLGNLPVPPKALANCYPLEGYPFMGMVAKSVILCPESLGEDVRRMCQQGGGRGVILTITDEDDEAMKTFMEERAAFLDIGIRKRLTRHGDKNIMELAME